MRYVLAFLLLFGLAFALSFLYVSHQQYTAARIEAERD